MDGIVVLPSAVAVVTEEGVKKLTGFKLWVHFADVGNKNGKCYSSTVAKHV